MSYVETLARANGAPLNATLEALGLPRRGLAGYGLLPGSTDLAGAAAATGLPKEVLVETFLLPAYDGIALLAPPHLTATTLRAMASRYWVHLSGSLACPECLREADGRWQLRWKFAWSVICTKHRRWLIDSCPACGTKLVAGQGLRCRPTFLGRIPSPGYCGANSNRGSGNAAEVCGYSLMTAAAAAVPVGDRILAVQTAIDSAFAGRGGCSAGQQVASLEYFTDLRALVLLLYLAGTRGEVRRVNLSSRSRWQVPPLALARRLVPIAGTLLALDSHGLRSALRPHLESLDRTTGCRKPLQIVKGFGASRGLAEAVAGAWSMRHLVGRRIRPGVSSPSFGADRLPALLWENWFDREFAELFRPTQRTIGRQYCSAALVRLATGCTLREAAQELSGSPDRMTSIWPQSQVHGWRIDEREAFLARLERLARWVEEGGDGIDYGERRRALSGLTAIDCGWWTSEAPADLQRRSAGLYLRQAAATWLWAELTGGDFRRAPAYGFGNADYRLDIYRRFVVAILPAVRQNMIAYGESLLTCGKQAVSC